MAVISSGRGWGEVLLRDYSHAARTFTSDPGYVLVPKFGFLFHVRFVYAQPDQTYEMDPSVLSVLVKSVELPKFRMDTEVLNKYNRKEIVQKRMVYEPITLVMNDDGENNVRDMWLSYNQWYYTDSNITPQAYAQNDTYNPNRLATRYGLDTGNSGRFLKSVDIYSMHNHVYTKYSLINPIIETFALDTHDYAMGNKTLVSQIRLQYESVLYAEGTTESIPGFGLDSPFYDNNYSPLTPVRLAIAQVENAVEAIENELAAVRQLSKRSNFDLQTLAPVTLNSNLAKQLKVDAASTLHGNQRFSFPTAQGVSSTKDLSTLISEGRLKQGVINRSSAISSNGSNIGSPATSSVGSTTADSQVNKSIIVYPKVPTNLTAAEATLFNTSYPPLPSTDPRVREAPYV